MSIKRTSSPKVTMKIAEDYFNIEITLNESPDATWQECFRNPSTFQLSEAYPRNLIVSLNKISMNSSPSKIKENVEWIDKYIQMANECYKKKMAELEAFRNRAMEEAQKRKEEIDKLNESIKDL